MRSSQQQTIKSLKEMIEKNDVIEPFDSSEGTPNKALQKHAKQTEGRLPSQVLDE